MSEYPPYRKVVVEKEPILGKRDRILYTFLFITTLISILWYFLWWINLAHIPHNFLHGFHVFDLLLFGLLIYVVFIGYLSSFVTWFSFLFASKPKKSFAPTQSLRVAFLTCYVPGKEPIKMLAKTLEAIKAVRYPHDTWVLDEGDSEEVKKLCRKLGVNHFTRKGSRRFNIGVFRKKTKAGNHNAWRHHHEDKYDIVAQVDMDHIPRPNFLEKTLGYFRDPSVAMVGTPEVYKKTKNWVMSGSSEQSAIFHFAMQTGYYGCDMPLLIGTSHLYRVSALREIGGYVPTIVEDHLTGMKLYSHGYKGVFVPKILAQGYGPLNWVDYFNQQFRWSYGLFEILFFYTPKLFLKLKWKQKINYLIAQTYYFTGPAVVFGAIITALYLWTGISPVNMRVVDWIYHALPPYMASQIIFNFIRLHSIRPGRIPLFGIKGKILNFGANIVYSLAFIALILRKKFTYAVTTKDAARQPSAVPLSTFSLHFAILVACAAGLVASIYLHHAASLQRIWGTFTVLSMAGVIISNYSLKIRAYIRKVKKTLFANQLGAKLAYSYLQNAFRELL